MLRASRIRRHETAPMAYPAPAHPAERMGPMGPTVSGPMKRLAYRIASVIMAIGAILGIVSDTSRPV
jgi:hypothetical protein